MHAFCTKDLKYAMVKMYSNECNGIVYIAQNNESIRNGTFDMQEFILPKELASANKVRVNVTMVSDTYNEVKGEPELSFGLYKDIAKKDLSKKFETQQFLHNYLISKYKVPLRITEKCYNCGVQKLTGVLNLREVNNPNMPLRTVVKFTENGFQRNQLKINPKVKIYAYLIELQKIR